VNLANSAGFALRKTRASDLPKTCRVESHASLRINALLCCTVGVGSFLKAKSLLNHVKPADTDLSGSENPH
jgi:hypothetical protein